MKKIYTNNKGLTLVELIISMALLGIISVSMLPLYTTSAMVINRTEHILEDTYTGKDVMELMYFLSSNTNIGDVEPELLSKGFSKNPDGVFIYEALDNKYIELEYTEQGDLVKVVTRVYSKINPAELETKYEAYYRWFRSGDAQ